MTSSDKRDAGSLVEEPSELEPFVDRPIMSAYLVFIAFVFVMINFIVDILYYFIDPRIRVKGDVTSG